MIAYIQQHSLRLNITSALTIDLQDEIQVLRSTEARGSCTKDPEKNNEGKEIISKYAYTINP